MKQDFYAASAAGVACVNAYTTHLTLKINCSLKTAILVLFISLPLIGNSQTAYTFSHQKGHSGRELVNVNGKLMQGVHEEHITVYVLRNTAKSLIVPENSFGYTRWFNYQTDSAIVTGTLGNLSGYSQVPGNKGYYNASNYAGDPTFSHNSNISSGVIANIACDLSYYKDYTVSYYPVYLIEPTLSQRVIFEVRPAQDIANAPYLSVNTNDDATGSYLEHSTITAPPGTV